MSKTSHSKESEFNNSLGIQSQEDNNYNEINKKFNRRKCSAFKHKPESRKNSEIHNESDQLCECSRPRSWHEDLQILSEDEEWSVKDHTTQIPCDVHGVMRLKGYGRVPKQARPKFICVDALMEDFEPLWKLMTEKWSMGDPDLILSINGGAKLMKGLSEKLTQELKEGIRGIVGSCTHVWIITSGFQTGVARLVGEAIKSEFDLHSEDSKVSVIGICTWGVVNKRNCLITEKPQYCKFDEKGLPISKYYNDPCSERGQSVFDPNHTHFILCDDGKEKRYGGDILLRPRFENFIREKKLKTGDSPAPVIQIVIEGGKNTIKTAYESMKSGTPVVFLEGTGRAADLVPLLISKVKPEMDRSTEAIKIVKEFLKPELKLGLDEEAEYEEWTIYLRDMVLDYRTKCHVFNIDGLFENLDKAVLLAVFQDSCDKALQLKLAMQMNRFDLAQQEIFTDEKAIWRDNLESFMDTAIQNDQAEFVEIFLNNGLNLESFVTRKRLINLYNYFTKEENKMNDRGVDLFRHLLEYHVKPWGCNPLAHNRDKDDKLIRIGELISLLAGRAFSNPYDYTEEIERSFYRTKDFYKRPDPSNERKYPTYPQYKKSSESRNKKQRVYGEQDLFFLCLLTHRYELAKLFCRLDRDPIACALVGVGLIKSLKKKAKRRGDTPLATEMGNFGSFLEQMATGALNLAYIYEKTRSHLLITRSQPHFGRHTSLSYANDHKCQEFLHHPACQSKLNSIWLGAIPRSKRMIAIVLNLFFSIFFIRLLFPYRNEENKAEPHTSNSTLDPGVVSTRAPTSREDHEYLSAKIRAKSMSTKSAKSFMNRFEERQIAGFKNIPYLKAIVLFYRAPITKFLLYMISNLIFLSLLSYVTLLTLKPLSVSGQPVVLEYIVWLWFITYLVEELRQALYGGLVEVRYRVAHWISSHWNKFDVFLYLLFIISTILRLTLSADMFLYARNVQCLSLSMFFLRFMRFYYANKNLGPKVIMIYRMINDLFFFVCIYMIFLLAYGTLAQGLQFPNQSEQWIVLKNVIYAPYWQTYGELDLESVEGDYNCTATDGSCARHSPLTVLAFVFFMLFTNILLINLLIAMFGYTFEKVQSSSEKLWAFNRFELITEFSERSFLPPPFSLIPLIIEFFMWLGKKCCHHPDQLQDDDFIVYLAKDEDSNLTTFAQKCMDMFWMKFCDKKMGTGDSLSASQTVQASDINVLNDKLARLDTRFNELDEKMERIFKRRLSYF